MIEEIWAEYQASLKRFLWTKLSDPEDVEDVLQEVLIKTHQNLEKLESPDSVKAWLFQIANRAVIDLYRRNGRSAALEGDSLWFEQDEEDAKTQLAQCMQPLIDSLPAASAALLTAVDLNGQSQKQLAQEMGISYSTLKSRIQKGRSDLRHTLEQCCQLSFDVNDNLMDFQPRKKGCGKCE
ncbi:RNA polymerase sigma factor SigZ [Vibrio nomapromontoriensis]|uniref:RNA polymerase sigma factor SigZ n=1 Tax=Vibrio nomapromontoriensis TaxID=2910246 RepID=UPI003D121753